MEDMRARCEAGAVSENLNIRTLAGFTRTTADMKHFETFRVSGIPTSAQGNYSSHAKGRGGNEVSSCDADTVLSNVKSAHFTNDPLWRRLTLYLTTTCQRRIAAALNGTECHG